MPSFFATSVSGRREFSASILRILRSSVSSFSFSEGLVNLNTFLIGFFLVTMYWRGYASPSVRIANESLWKCLPNFEKSSLRYVSKSTAEEKCTPIIMSNVPSESASQPKFLPALTRSEEHTSELQSQFHLV